MIVGNYTITNGIFEYNFGQNYTAGDVVFIRKSNNLVEFYVCIKNSPPGVELTNGEYFTPMWYHDVINSYTDIFENHNQNQNRVINKRTLQSVLQSKFGTGILISDSSSFENRLDLNNVRHTGRYIVYVKNIRDVLNFPHFILAQVGTNNVQTVYGLDVYKANNVLYQVLFANNNNMVTISIRKYENNTWSQWETIRNSIQMNMINNIINSNQQIINNYLVNLEKQVFGLRLDNTQWSWNNSNKTININISNIHFSIFRNIELININCVLDLPGNPTVRFLYNHIMPIPQNTGNFTTFFYTEPVPVSVSSNSITIDINELFSNRYINNITIQNIILMI